ncbi:MAG TPA: rhamnulokinase family protein [Anaerolineae bacterium]
MNGKCYIALDLGGSARCVVGSFDGKTLALETIARFANPFVRTLGWVYWDALGLFAALTESLRQVAERHERSALAGLGVDAMGGAFALLDGNGELLGNPRYSRLPQRAAVLTEAFGRVPPEDIFAQTGLQPGKLRALYGLLELQLAGSPQLKAAQTLLMLPDLLNYWLSGRMAAEYTIASTSQLLDARTRDWARPLLAAMQLPTHILPEIVQPGQALGSLHPTVIADTGLPPLPVIATVSHDTAAAIAAVPVATESWAFLSSGTWGMVGAERTAPILTDQARKLGFSNEGGAGGTVRFTHNNLNLWLLQGCQQAWRRQGQDPDWNALVRLAGESEPFLAVIDPNHPAFLMPDDMPQAIRAFCRDTGQVVPQTPGQIVRVILESLALMYRDAVDRLAEVQGRRPEWLYLIGGGGYNRLLNQFAANATGLPVSVGPFEATAAGNMIMQMIALGDLSGVAEGRELICRSFPTETFVPQDTAMWDEHVRRYGETTSS